MKDDLPNCRWGHCSRPPMRIVVLREFVLEIRNLFYPVIFMYIQNSFIINFILIFLK
jgi:hypothetical protein